MGFFLYSGELYRFWVSGSSRFQYFIGDIFDLGCQEKDKKYSCQYDLSGKYYNYLPYPKSRGDWVGDFPGYVAVLGMCSRVLYIDMVLD